MRPVGTQTTASGPGRYFANHPAVYRIALAGSGGTTLYAVWRIMRTAGARRVAWVALALVETAITAGMTHAHGRGTAPARATTHAEATVGRCLSCGKR
jgi:hypothetical protein